MLLAQGGGALSLVLRKRTDPGAILFDSPSKSPIEFEL